MTFLIFLAVVLLFFVCSATLIELGEMKKSITTLLTVMNEILEEIKKASKTANNK